MKNIKTKKIIFWNREEGIESPDSCDTIYYGLDDIIYGGWILTTSGDPITLYVCEEAEDQDTIQLVDRLIEEAENGKRDSNEIGEEDIKYINDWLRIWGINGRI